MQRPLIPPESQPDRPRDADQRSANSSSNSGASSSSGLTLLELTLAILVLALASLAALRSSDQARRAIGGEMPRLMARIAVQNRIEELALYGPAGGGLPDRVVVGNQQIRLSTQSAATAGGLLRTEVRGRAASGEGAALVAYLATGPRP